MAIKNEEMSKTGPQKATSYEHFWTTVDETPEQRGRVNWLECKTGARDGQHSTGGKGGNGEISTPGVIPL